MNFLQKNSFFVNFHTLLELALEGSLDRTTETWLHEKRRTYEGMQRRSRIKRQWRWDHYLFGLFLFDLYRP